MDLLQRELQRKKQALAIAKEEASVEYGDDVDDGMKKRKYFKISDLRRIEEEQEEVERLRKLETLRYGAHGQEDKKRGEKDSISSTPSSAKTEAPTLTKELMKEGDLGIPLELKMGKEQEKSKTQDTSPKAVTQKLRQMGLVIRFFGESNDDRLKRLHQALEQRTKALQGLSELEEFRLGKGHDIRNTFLDRKKDNSLSSSMAKAGRKTAAKDDQPVDSATGNKYDDKGSHDDDKSDPPKYIYRFLKDLLKQWEQDLTERPESVAQSAAGKNETKTLKQCKDYIRPLFKLLKSRNLEDEMQRHLLVIADFAKQGEFVKAHDAYMDVAIGRSAWPIGVTQVGIHARTGRSKIESSNVAHIMNSELQRKYLTSVKRLLTYAQKKRTDVDPSKKVG